VVLRRFGVCFVEPTEPLGPGRVVAEFPRVPGLYLHLPFCRTLCPFCPYNKVRYVPSEVAEYTRLLAREAAAYLSEGAGPFPSLYVGGGTPSLCLEEIGPLLDVLEVSGERAIEVLPSHMTRDGARRLRELGFDFVSLGVQSFDAGVLARLRRPTTPRDNRAAVENAVGRFACVDVDLIFDTVFDRPEVLLDDLATCFAYGVDQVSTYPLMRFGFTPFGKGRHDARREHRVLRAAGALALKHGYERSAVWTFRRPGGPSYSSITRPYHLGLGAGAATFAGGLFTVNHFAPRLYAEAIARGRLPIARVARLPPAAAALYRAFWQAYGGRLPAASDDPLLRHAVVRAAVAAGRALGLLRRAGDAFELTSRGYSWLHDLERWVTYHLIEPLWGEMMREHELGARSPRAA